MELRDAWKMAPEQMSGGKRKPYSGSVFSDSLRIPPALSDPPADVAGIAGTEAAAAAFAVFALRSWYPTGASASVAIEAFVPRPGYWSASDGLRPAETVAMAATEGMATVFWMDRDRDRVIDSVFFALRSRMYPTVMNTASVVLGRRRVPICEDDLDAGAIADACSCSFGLGVQPYTKPNGP